MALQWGLIRKALGCLLKQLECKVRKPGWVFCQSKWSDLVEKLEFPCHSTKVCTGRRHYINNAQTQFGLLWKCRWMWGEGRSTCQEGFTNSVDMSLRKLQEIMKDRETSYAAVHRVAKSWMWLSDWTTIQIIALPIWRYACLFFKCYEDFSCLWNNFPYMDKA